jgi:3-hydroxyacyl-[acyl-carrier-protein] dehydratase
MTDLVEAGAPLRRDGRWDVPIEADRIRGVLPHRWPFLYLDRITELQPGRSGVGIKNVTVSEPHFAGHFPHSSIMPGVLLIESMAQLAGVVMASAEEVAATGKTYLAAVHRMSFRVPARPGDQLILSAVAGTRRGHLVDFQVAARVSGRPIADGRLVVAA